MAADKYVRITPYDKKSGAFCQRYVIGGRLFEGGKWYKLPADWAERVKELKQDSGAPVFQVMSEAVFEETARREMSAAMVASGLAGLAMAPAQTMPTPTEPKAGPRTGSYKGLESAVKEVDTTTPPAPEGPSVEVKEVAEFEDEGEEAPEKSDKPNLDDMRKDELLALADKLGVSLPAGASTARIRALLRDRV